MTPLQHQEHETGHDRRLQSTVARIVTTTRDVLKRTVDVSKLANQSKDGCGIAAGERRKRPPIDGDTCRPRDAREAAA